MSMAKFRMGKCSTDTLKNSIKPIVIEEIRVLAKKYGMDKVILFGSCARDDYKHTSDIDIAVYGGDINRFAADVDEKTLTLLKFDIVDMDSPMQEELRASIMRKSVPLYEKI